MRCHLSFQKVGEHKSWEHLLHKQEVSMKTINIIHTDAFDCMRKGISCYLLCRYNISFDEIHAAWMVTPVTCGWLILMPVMTSRPQRRMQRIWVKSHWWCVNARAMTMHFSGDVLKYFQSSQKLGHPRKILLFFSSSSAQVEHTLLDRVYVRAYVNKWIGKVNRRIFVLLFINLKRYIKR